MKYYVVSDVHGFYPELEAALRESGFFEEKEPRKLIICGDLFDRGKETLKMQEFILDLMKKDELILIRGNHEDLILELATNLDKWMKLGILNTHHYRNGTLDTLLTLTGMTLEEAYDAPDECAKRFRETVFFNKIIPAMKDFYETENYIFVHGWIPCFALGRGSRTSDFTYLPDWRELGESAWEAARWYNGMRVASEGVLEPLKTIVCGHFHASYGHSVLDGKGSEFEEDADFSPYYAEGICAIDACTAHTGKINCVVIED